MTQKRLQPESTYNTLDLDGDGVVSDNELAAAEARRHEVASERDEVTRLAQERQAVPPVRREGAAVVAADADGPISPQEPVSIIAAGERCRRAVLVLAGVGLVERDPIACFGEPYIHDQCVAVEVGASAVGVETVPRRQRVAIANHGIGYFSPVDIG